MRVAESALHIYSDGLAPLRIINLDLEEFFLVWPDTWHNHFFTRASRIAIIQRRFPQTSAGGPIIISFCLARVVLQKKL